MNIIRKFFKWVFKDELNKLKKIQENYERNLRQQESSVNSCHEIKKRFEAKLMELEGITGGLEVSCDVSPSKYGSSWAVVSLRGRQDYIKFYDLKDANYNEIINFMKRFDNHKIDADPMTTKFMRSVLR